MSVNTFSDHVEDLSGRISATPELEWTDILPLARTLGAYGQKQISMPFDLDFVTILLRDDLRDRYERETGGKQPRTWEEFADYVECEFSCCLLYSCWHCSCSVWIVFGLDWLSDLCVVLSYSVWQCVEYDLIVVVD